MILRQFVLLGILASVALGCSCSAEDPKTKLENASIAFRATIVELKNSTTKVEGIEIPERIVVFKVSRVWKGEVSETFAMLGIEETSFCIGFWPPYLAVGTELLIYANGSKDLGYITQICGGHMLADASTDLQFLGEGAAPKR